MNWREDEGKIVSFWESFFVCCRKSCGYSGLARMTAGFSAYFLAAGLLAGCGNHSTEGQTSADGAVGNQEASAGDTFTGFDELQTIEVYGMSFYGEDGLTEVMEEINAILEEEINVHVNYTTMDVATYMEQIGLMLSGGESFDLVMATAIPSVSFGTMQSQNQLMDITDLLPVYAPELTELMADYIPATTVDGVVYGVPCYRQYNGSGYLVMRKDVLDELGLTEQAREIDSWDDAEVIFKAVQEAQDSLPAELRTTAVVCNSDGQGSLISGMTWETSANDWSEHEGFDVLGNSNKLIIVDDDGKVQNFFESDEYRGQIELVHSWYEEGLVYKDAATTVETGDTLVKNGVSFATFLNAEYGVEATKGATIGREIVCVEICESPVQTYNVNQWAWCVPTTSESPEAAVAFMNLMYTNAEIENLFAYGIEGRDYELTENGEARVLEDAVYQCSDFLFGNQFLAYPAAGNGGDFRTLAEEDLKEATRSPYLGCVVNTDPIANELTAISNVLNKYEKGLESGTLDPSVIDTMVEELNAAGAQEVVEYYQTCLDEWLAKQ